jgi:5'-nucleotidase
MMRLERKKTRGRCLAATAMGLLVGLAAVSGQAAGETETRDRAEQKITWRSPDSDRKTIPLKLLSINDFHGQITAGLTVDGRPVGSAPVLAAYLKAAQAKAKGRTFIVHAGDHVGASQPQSALLQDEPGIMFFNMLGNDQCRTGGQYGPDCNLVGIPGNHELDEGQEEMLRLIQGGNHHQGPYIQNPYQGAAFPYICANLVQAASGQPLFRPYVVRMVDGVPIGFIGAVLHRASTFLSPESLEGLRVLDEADAINIYVNKLKAEGVRTIIAIIHQGGYQLPAGESSPPSGRLVGDIAPIVERLDGEVDVVLSGHTHTYHNILVNNAAGRPTLVVQAWPKGTGYADIDLEISPATNEVVAMSSRIVTTWADHGPGLQPDSRVAALAAQVDAMGNAIAKQVIAHAAKPITRTSNEAGESALGDLVADAQRQVMGTDFAFMHPEGIEADISSGTITKGDHFTVQPANLNLIKLEMTGRQIYELLNQQWSSQTGQGRFLQISGLTYTWDADRPAGQRIVAVMKEGAPLNTEKKYTVAVNEYLAGGGGNFTVLTQGANPVVGPFVADALIQYVRTQPQPINAEIEGRISRLN